MITKLRKIYHEYPRQFWLLIAAFFVDMVGNALVWPFFALFLTDKYDIGLREVGVLMGVYSLAGLVGGAVGGALADRMGRKPILLVGLLASATGNLAFVLVGEFALLYVVAVTLGVLGSVGGPAAQAMMADLLPEEQRAEGYSIMRVEFNLAVTIGPMLGGLLAGVSYVLLFSIDALTSVITAVVLLVALRETRPETTESAEPETLVETFRGYGEVLRDVPFMLFVLLGLLVSLVYHQMNNTLPVYMRDAHGYKPYWFGLLLTINAAIVVLTQFWVTRRVRRYPRLLVMAASALVYAVGFGMYGFVAGFALFVVAMVIITVGEMMLVPVSQAMAADFAKEHMRGRYMAVFGFSFSIASALGTWLAGVVIDAWGHNWVWYLSGMGGVLAAAGYVWLHLRFNPAERPDPSFDAGSLPEVAVS